MDLEESPFSKPLQFRSSEPGCLTVSWAPPSGSHEAVHYGVTWKYADKQHFFIVYNTHYDIQDLSLGEPHLFTVATVNAQGIWRPYASGVHFAAIPAPRNVRVQVNGNLPVVTWSHPKGIINAKYQLNLLRNKICIKTVITESASVSLRNIQLDRYCVVHVYTLSKNGCPGYQSEPAITDFKDISDVYNQPTRHPRDVNMSQTRDTHIFPGHHTNRVKPHDLPPPLPGPKPTTATHNSAEWDTSSNSNSESHVKQHAPAQHSPGLRPATHNTMEWESSTQANVDNQVTRKKSKIQSFTRRFSSKGRRTTRVKPHDPPPPLPGPKPTKATHKSTEWETSGHGTKKSRIKQQDSGQHWPPHEPHNTTEWDSRTHSNHGIYENHLGKPHDSAWHASGSAIHNSLDYVNNDYQTTGKSKETKRQSEWKPLKVESQPKKPPSAREEREKEHKGKKQGKHKHADNATGSWPEKMIPWIKGAKKKSPKGAQGKMITYPETPKNTPSVNGWSFYFIASQKSQSTLRMFKSWLNENHIKETSAIQKCDFILVACLVVSRIGTDIEAVLRLIPDDNRPCILMVIHHTFNPEYVVPDSRRFVKGKNMLLVDFLYYEDEGLLRSETNRRSFDEMSHWLRQNVQVSYV